jgi:hypothetical protein
MKVNSGNNSYLIVSDLHEGKKKENRIDYMGELDKVHNQINKIINQEKSFGRNVYVIFLGDVFDRGYKDTFKACNMNNFFIVMRSKCKGLFSVIGNHELTYYTGNPFFTLINSVESKRVRTILNKTWTPQGITSTIVIPDEIIDGDVKIAFNHYSTEVDSLKWSGTKIGLFHQTVTCREIIEDAKRKFGEELYGLESIEAEGVFASYNYAFLGHAHKLYGQFKFTDETLGCDCVTQYLASLGRPNVTEVRNDFLERDIPVIRVDNGRFTSIEHNKFNLMSREECVIEAVVEKQQETYKKIKARKAIRDYDPLGDNPIENLKNRCMTSDELLGELDGLIKDEKSSFEKGLDKIKENFAM